MVRRIATAAAVGLVLAGCGGPKVGGVYVLPDPVDIRADSPLGGEEAMLGSGSIVRVVDSEDGPGGARYLKLYVERQTGTGDRPPAFEGRTGYLRAEDFKGSPTPAP